jgi:cob(I)alamin adenosyltransferase
MIYTKKGDNGFTGLYGTIKRVSKSSKTIRALGALDEANSYLGIVKSSPEIDHIQENLILIGSILAGAKKAFPETETTKLEQAIDLLEKKLPLLTQFILPKGHFMFARALVRRAEREVVSLKSQKTILTYLNRLSDYLFMKGRNRPQQK